MKKLLIVGKDSYIGTHFKSWMAQYKDEYQVDELSVLDDSWREFSFAGYDSVLHVAGIAHVSSDPKQEELYYRVNCDLTAEVATKAKLDGVHHFVFMSSMIVYGADGGVGKAHVIAPQTTPAPENFYGNSKLMAEEKLSALSDEGFSVAKVRPPMVYGPSCKGNFPLLINLAKTVAFFPNIQNERSMIYIDNLCEFLRILIINKKSGIFFPQNTDYVSTQQIIVMARKLFGKPTYLVSLFNPIIGVLSPHIRLINKVLGSKTYQHQMSDVGENYQIVGFEESIRLCVMNRWPEINLNM